MTKPTRRWLAAIAVAATALTLAACDGGGEGPTTPPETTATEPSTAPSEDVTTEETATPPEVERPTAPPEMEVDDTVGASAAVWYFLELYDYMGATGDTATWEAMSSPDCEWCMAVLSDTQALHDAGGWIDGPGLDFDITASEVEYPDTEHPYYVVRLRVVEQAFTQVNGDGSTQEGDEAVLDPFAIAVQYIDGGFEVIGVNFEVQ